MRLRWCLPGLLACAGCGDAGTATDGEVAAELRALRAVLVQQAAEPSGSQPTFDPSLLTTAMNPLREALEGLGRQQSDLQQRQLALTQEMQRWSQLLVGSVGEAHREEGAALTARLQQLETALQQQDARHREMEVLLQGALDRTADRLEDFLKRLGDEARPAPTKEGSGQPAASPGGPKSVGEVQARRGAARNAAWWWGGVAVLGACFGFVCFRRWQRRAGPSAPRPVAAPMPQTDPGVQEIWAAAALLGEAVGRLRSTATPNEPQPLPEPASSPLPPEGTVPASDLEDDPARDLEDFVVLDDELLHPKVPARGPVGHAGEAPPSTVCHIRSEDPGKAMQAVMQVLGSDPRVLRRPEPTVRCSRDNLEVTFRALPGLPAGEKSHLEQRLRDACA